MEIYKDEPWHGPNDNGEMPGDICCQRAAGNRCFEHEPNNWSLVDGQWQNIAPLRELDRHILTYRANGYYRNGPKGVHTIVGSGFTTQFDAHRLCRELRKLGLLEDVHVEVYMQGKGWFRESDRGVPDSEVYLDDFVKPIQQ